MKNKKQDIDWKKSYLKLKNKIREDIPNFRVRYKDESIFMKILSWILFFSKGFMKTATTTIYPVVYFPRESFVIYDYERAFRILSHEYVHLLDRKNEGVIFNLKYLFPQILSLLSLLSLLAFWSPWFLLLLGFLAFLAPWPSRFREQYELSGYLMNLHHDENFGWDTTRARVEELVAWSFTSWRYYRMTSKSKANKVATQFQILMMGKPELLERVQACYVRTEIQL